MENRTFQIPADSFISAATLSRTFNVGAGDARENECVGAVLEKAVAFVKDLTPELLRERQLLRERSWGDEVFLSRDDAQKYSEAIGAGYSLGEAGVSLSVETVNNLQYLRDFFRLRSDEDAARLAIACYTRLQNAQTGDSKYVMADAGGRHRTDFSATPYYLKRNV